MDRLKSLSPLVRKRSFASRLFGYDVFLSFALGPAPRGSHSYASDLARRLEQRDFTVFFSEEEMPPGEQLDGGLRKALLRSRALVVVSNRGTLQDPRWVRKEVEEFRRGRPGRPVIPVNIGSALQDPSLADSAQTWLDFVGRVWVDDTEEAVAQGIASQEVVDRLAVVPRSARANTKWRWIVRGSVAALCALVLGLAISTKVALDNARRARAELREAVASRLAIQGQQMLNGSRAGGDLRAILQVLVASRFSTTPEAAGALFDALVATRNVRKLLATDVPVESVSVSPNGKRIASVHNDHTVRLWDAATGQLLGNPLKGHSRPVTIVAYSPDGRLLASGSNDGTLQLWDTETGEARGAPLKAGSSPTTGLAFSPDGRRIVSSGGGGDELRMWDSATGRALNQTTPPDRQSINVGALAFSPDGRRIISTSGVVWDPDTLKAAGGPIHEQWHLISAVAFSPDGRSIVTGGFDRTVRLWDRKFVFNADGGIVSLRSFLERTVHPGDFGNVMPRGAPLAGHAATVRSAAFSSDGRRIVSGSLDGTVCLWDAVSGRLLDRLEGHRAGVSSVAFTPDGSVVSGSTGSNMVESLMATLQGVADPTEPDIARIRIWMPVPGRSLSQVLRTFADLFVRIVALSPDGRRIATTGLRPDGRQTATSDDDMLRVWNAATGEPLGAPMDGGAVLSVAFSPDGRRVASSSRDRTIRIWDGETGRPVSQLVGHADEVFRLAFSPDGQRLASGSWTTLRNSRAGSDGSRQDSEFRLWDAVTGSLASVSRARFDRVAFSPDNRRNIRAGSDGSRDDSEFRLWDAVTGRLVSVSKARVHSVAFSPDNRRIVSGGSNGIRLWDARSGASLSELLEGHKGFVTSVAFSLDSRLIASGSNDKTIRLWDSQTGRAIGAPLQGHRGFVETIAFSPDGRQLVSGDTDKTIRVWDTRSGQPVGPPLEGHTGTLTAVAFSPDGLSIVSAAGDKTVRRWPAPMAWAGVLCSKVTRNLSPKEWREWVSAEIPYECQCSGLPIPADDGQLEQSRTCNVK